MSQPTKTATKAADAPDAHTAGQGQGAKQWSSGRQPRRSPPEEESALPRSGSGPESKTKPKASQAPKAKAKNTAKAKAAGKKDEALPEPEPTPKTRARGSNS